MDLHTMISDDVHINGDHPPVSADQVIEEIDEILQTSDLIRSMTTDRTVESVDSMYSSMRSPFTASSSVGGGDYRSKTNGYHVPIEGNLQLWLQCIAKLHFRAQFLVAEQANGALHGNGEPHPSVQCGPRDRTGAAGRDGVREGGQEQVHHAPPRHPGPEAEVHRRQEAPVFSGQGEQDAAGSSQWNKLGLDLAALVHVRDDPIR